MRSRTLQCVVIAGCLFASGCANLAEIRPGETEAAVVASNGKPYRVWQETNGGSSLEYPMGPEGRYTYMVRLGPDGRVSRVDQVLGWDTFRLVTRGMPMDQVEHLLGRPYSKVAYPRTGETAWSWRFVETVWRRCFYAYEGPDGKVVSTGVRDESPGTMAVGLEIPC